MTKTMAFAVLGKLVLTVHTDRAPSPAEWASYVRALNQLTREERDYQRIRNLVITEGGAPDSAQRKAVNDIISSKYVTAAVVSGSPVVRATVTAFSWFNNSIKAFAPHEMNDAFRHLELSSFEVELVDRRLSALRRELAEHVVRATG
jgi:hypothetical protein